MTINKTIVAGIAALTLAAGTTATALAANDTSAPTASQSSQSSTPSTNGTQSTTPAADRKESKRGGQHGKRDGHKTVLEALGITKEELKAARKADKSLAELAADKGIDKTTLTTKLTAHLKERLDKAVKDGKLTQKQADTKLEKMTTKLKERIDTKPSQRPERARGGHGKRGGHHGHHGKRDGHKAVLEALGITKEELKAARKADKSLTELAADKGIDKTTLTTKLTAHLKERLNKAVADGKITQEQADTKLEKMTTKLQERIDTKPSELPARGKRHQGERGNKTAAPTTKTEATGTAKA